MREETRFPTVLHRRPARGSPLLRLPLRRWEGWGTPVLRSRFVDRFGSCGSGGGALLAAVTAQRIRFPRIQLHLVGVLRDGDEGFVGGVFLRPFGVVDLGFPGSVGAAAAAADPVGFLFLRLRPSLAGISSGAGRRPGGLYRSWSADGCRLLQAAAAAFSEGRVLWSTVGGCWQAGLFLFPGCAGRGRRIRGPTSTGKVPADEPHGLDLAVRGESLIRLTTQCSAMVLGGSGCDGCVSWFSPVGLRQRRRAVARDDVVVCRTPRAFLYFVVFGVFSAFVLDTCVLLGSSCECCVCAVPEYLI